MIEIVKDVDLINHIENYDVVLVGTNTYITMSNGFQRKIKENYPQVFMVNLSTKYADMNKLGTHSICKVKDTVICLCYITHSYNFRPDIQSDYLDYEALEKCLITINYLFSGKRIATTLIGCSKWDGNGDRDKVLEIINRCITDCHLTLYDYIQRDIKEVDAEEWHKLKELKKTNWVEFYNTIRKRKERQHEQNKIRNYFRQQKANK